MTEERARSIDTWCKVITTFVTIAGASALLIQFSNYVETRRSENRKRQDELLAKLYSTDIDLHKHLTTNPDLHTALFYDKDGKAFNSLKDDRKQACLATCQMFGDLLEYYLLLADGLQGPEATEIKDAWVGYIKYFQENSAAMRQYLADTDATWTRRLMMYFPKEQGGAKGGGQGRGQGRGQVARPNQAL